MHMSVKFYSSIPSNNVAVRHYLGFILVLGKKTIVPLGHNLSKYNKFFLSQMGKNGQWLTVTSSSANNDVDKVITHFGLSRGWIRTNQKNWQITEQHSHWEDPCSSLSTDLYCSPPRRTNIAYGMPHVCSI